MIGHARRLGIGWKDLVAQTDSEEISYQMAYDLIEGEERQRLTPAAPALFRSDTLIALDDPEIFTKVKVRLGL